MRPTPGTPTANNVSNATSVRAVLQFGAAIAAASCPPESGFQEWITAAVSAAARPASLPLTVTVRVVDEQEGATLKSDYRGKAGPTNVLAFPAEMPPIPPAELDELELGDLVICLGVAEQEAVEQGKSTAQHLAHLTVHGTLHLLGFDHIEEADAEAMEALERRVLEGLGLPDPYA